MFIGQFLKGNMMGSIKIHNRGNYAHVQDSDASANFIKSVHWTDFKGQYQGTNKKIYRGKLRNYFAIVLSP